MESEGQEFKGVKGQWNVIMTLRDCSLFIETISDTSMEHYETEMTPEKIQADRNMAFLFQNSAELFLFLSSSFANLEVRGGELSISVDMPLGKISRKVVLKIETHRREVDESVLREIRFRKIQGELDELRLENEQLKRRVKGGQEQIGKLREVFRNFELTLSQKDEVITSIFVELRQIRAWKEEKEKEEQSRMKRKFNADPTNPHNTKFLQLGNRYKKLGGGSWDVLICQNPIEKNDNFRYTIRQIRAGSGGSFMYGIGTSTIKGINRAQDNKEFIGYYENTGNIYDRGESRRGGPRIKDGDIIVIEVDTRNWTITWMIEGNKEAQISISGQLRVKPLYLAFVIYNDEAEIQFI